MSELVNLRSLVEDISAAIDTLNQPIPDSGSGVKGIQSTLPDGTILKNGVELCK